MLPKPCSLLLTVVRVWESLFIAHVWSVFIAHKNLLFLTMHSPYAYVASSSLFSALSTLVACDVDASSGHATLYALHLYLLC